MWIGVVCCLIAALALHISCFFSAASVLLSLAAWAALWMRLRQIGRSLSKVLLGLSVYWEICQRDLEAVFLIACLGKRWPNLWLILIPASQSLKVPFSIAEDTKLNTFGARTQPCLHRCQSVQPISLGSVSSQWAGLLQWRGKTRRIEICRQI